MRNRPPTRLLSALKTFPPLNLSFPPEKGIVIFVIALLAAALAALGAALAALYAKSETSASAASPATKFFASACARLTFGAIAFVCAGAGDGLGANAASVVWTAYVNLNSDVDPTQGAAAPGLGLGAFACLLAFAAFIVDVVAATGCCCGRQPGVVFVDASGMRPGTVVVLNDASAVNLSALGSSSPAPPFTPNAYGK